MATSERRPALAFARRRVGSAGTRAAHRLRTGALRERFAGDWSPLRARAGPPVEPGHLFEWAWLLLQCDERAAGAVRSSAERLAEIGETRGVLRGVAVNGLGDDLAVADGAARLWPQTERLKAAVLWADSLNCRAIGLPRCRGYRAIGISRYSAAWAVVRLAQRRGVFHAGASTREQLITSCVPSQSFPTSCQV